MKKVLLATTALMLTAGASFAEVTLSGDGRMGILHSYNADTNADGKVGVGDAVDTVFTSRARVSFGLSAESESGLSFGGSFRPQDAGAAAGNTAMSAGSVFVKGAFGTLTFGDNDSAANQMVGNVSGVGLTGLGDNNELGYIGHTDTSVSYNHAVGAVAFAVSVGQQAGVATATANANSMSLGVKYSTDAFGIALGYEQADVGFAAVSTDQLSLGLSGSFSGVGLKLVTIDNSATGTATAVSADYTTGATTLTAFFADKAVDAYGIGGSYDLGGGAKFVGGIVDNGTDTIADMGLSFSF